MTGGEGLPYREEDRDRERPAVGSPGEGEGGADGAALARREEAAAAMSRRLRRGLLATAGAVAVLSLGTSLPLWDVLGLPLFYVLLPALALAQLPVLGVERLERIPVYVGSALTILVIGALALALGARLDGPEALGLRGLPGGTMFAWTAGLTLGGLLVIGVFRPLDRRWGGDRSRFLAQLLPRTPGEKGTFVGLSLAAGLGEELAYRGYALVGLLLLGIGAWTAAVLSSVAFGFLHAYQGPVGVARTALLGFLLAVPVLLTGSLLPSMAAHVLIDVAAGLVIGPRILAGDEGGVSGEEGPGTLVPFPPEG